MSLNVTWTNELTYTLIDLYRLQSALWDSTNENYRNKHIKKDAWKSISDAMGIHELEIQRKVKNLASQFFREKRKMKNDDDASKWFPYQRLLFLADRNEPRLCVEKGIGDETHDIDPERITEEEISKNESALPTGINTNVTTVQPPPNSQPGCSRIHDTRKNIRSSKRKTTNYDQRQKKAYNVLKELQAKKPRNRFNIFGELVATKIEALESSYAQNMVEHLISNILFEGSMGKYDYPDARQMTPFSSHSSNSNFSVHTHFLSPEYAPSPSPKLE